MARPVDHTTGVNTALSRARLLGGRWAMVITRAGPQCHSDERRVSARDAQAWNTCFFLKIQPIHAALCACLKTDCFPFPVPRFYSHETYQKWQWAWVSALTYKAVLFFLLLLSPSRKYLCPAFCFQLFYVHKHFTFVSYKRQIFVSYFLNFYFICIILIQRF